MLFPFQPNTLHRDPLDPAQRIEREVGDRGRRLVIGLSLEPNNRLATGALVVVAGKGKYLRPIRSVTCSRPLPKETTQMLARSAKGHDVSLLDVEAIQHDVALLLAGMVEELKRHAGKYVERLLLLAVMDQGLLRHSEAADSQYLPLCNAEVLAETSGISVVDSFPARVLATGGRTVGLTALPSWLLFADRAPKQASRNRLAIRFGAEAEAFFLPASDGSDLELPEIRFAHTACLSLLEELLETITTKNPPEQGIESALARLSLNGNFNEPLRDRFTESGIFEARGSRANVAASLTNLPCSLPDQIRTSLVCIVDGLTTQIRKQIGEQQVHDIVVDTHPDMAGTFLNQLQRSWPKATFRNDFAGYGADSEGNLNSILAGVLGTMSIDQMPANVPWITGTSSQKLLGKITPGSPSSWRQLLREMADYQPPAMRLRDAV